MPSRYLIEIGSLSFGGVVFPGPLGPTATWPSDYYGFNRSVSFALYRIDSIRVPATVRAMLLVRLNNMVVVFFAALECPVFMGKPELI